MSPSRGGTRLGPALAVPAGLRQPPPARLRRYGLAPADWVALGAFQGWACFICRRPFGWRRPPQVDHDHVTGQVMGLLCGRCNHELLGVFGRDPRQYRRADDYLRGDVVLRALGRRVFHEDAPPEAAPGPSPADSEAGTSPST